MLVEVLARGVAVGLARMQQEEAAMRARVQFEQFFTPELSHELTANPDLLKGRDATISVLFCDIRGFSRISEILGPAGTVDWLNDVMTVFSECVLKHSGVLVDYIGDELMAMWGAPIAVEDHARRATLAALSMIDQLPALRERWQKRIGEPMEIGIGINSGMARVGNTGTQRKFKYGPLGNNVNLASRLQGATKYLKTRLLVSGATQKLLGPEFATRRLTTVRVVNIVEPVELFEVVPQGEEGWKQRKTDYEEALAFFEGQEFRAAARILGGLVTDYREDGPALVLLSRVVNALIEPPEPFDPVWQLPGK
ncbi:MAG: hypothetical protein KatS3mg105_4737 [Gemmatales bacterium]|nr:MAG: hypothetical protein KatS3mg105_4737 [Gemmatales bacterium]